MTRNLLDRGNNVTPLTLCVTRQGVRCRITYLNRACVANMIDLMAHGVPAEYLGIYYAIGTQRVIMLTNKYKHRAKRGLIDKLAHLVFRRSIAFFLLLRVPLHKIAELHNLEFDALMTFVNDEMEYFVAVRRIWQNPGNQVLTRIKNIYGVQFELFANSKEYLTIVKRYYIQTYSRDVIDYRFNYERAIR